MTLCFIVDEDLPRSTAKALIAAGYDALDVRDVGLKGAKDYEILTYASHNQLTVITADIGFGSLVYLSPIACTGIILLRIPSEFTISRLNAILLNALNGCSPEDIVNSIIVVDQHKVRIRRIRG